MLYYKDKLMKIQDQDHMFISIDGAVEYTDYDNLGSATLVMDLERYDALEDDPNVRFHIDYGDPREGWQICAQLSEDYQVMTVEDVPIYFSSRKVKLR